RRDLVLLGQDLLGADHLVKDGPAAEQLDAGLARTGVGRSKLVDTAYDPFLGPLGHGGMAIVVIGQRDVVDQVLLVLVHPLRPVHAARGGPVAVGRVVSSRAGEGDGSEMAMAARMLQTLARQTGAARGGAEHEAAGALIAGGPDQLADPLEAEDRIIDEER